MLRNFKQNFDIDDFEEKNYMVIRENYSFAEQAKLFYEALLIKRAQISKLKYQNNNLDKELEKALKTVNKLESKTSIDDNKDLKEENQKLKRVVEHYKKKYSELKKETNTKHKYVQQEPSSCNLEIFGDNSKFTPLINESSLVPKTKFENEQDRLSNKKTNIQDNLNHQLKKSGLPNDINTFIGKGIGFLNARIKGSK